MTTVVVKQPRSMMQDFGAFMMLLTLLFIGLKLTDFIDWSWWLVLLPLYGVPAAILAVVVVIFVGAGIVGFINGRPGKPGIRYRGK